MTEVRERLEAVASDQSLINKQSNCSWCGGGSALGQRWYEMVMETKVKQAWSIVVQMNFRVRKRNEEGDKGRNGLKRKGKVNGGREEAEKDV